MRISPLRLWLQSSSLLAVLAGYSLFLLMHLKLEGWQRASQHEALANQVLAQLSARASNGAELNRELRQLLAPGLQIQALAGAPPSEQPQPRGLEHPSAGSRIVSRKLIQLADGSRHALLLSQDVSPSMAQEGRVFWLLVIAAGVSSLFTSALLRLVVHRGLSRPLQEFSHLLRNIQAPPVEEDVIELEQQPEELQPIGEAFNELHQRLRKSWERQRLFVDGLAHELRTPITLISGHSQSLLRQAHPPEQTRQLTLIEQESERMRALVSDLLDLARQDSGRLSISQESIDLDILLVETYERLAEPSHGRLRVSLAEDPNELQGISARGDQRRLQQCLVALIDNALKYSPAASPVTLRCSRGDQHTVVVHVCDRGPGVQADERQAIFQRFVRGQAALNTTIRGSGLGLALVRELMEAMQGEVRVADNPGGGADFQLHLPAFSR